MFFYKTAWEGYSNKLTAINQGDLANITVTKWEGEKGAREASCKNGEQHQEKIVLTPREGLPVE